MIEGYPKAHLQAAIYVAITHAGFLARRVHLQNVDPDDRMMGGPWPHVVVLLERSPWWWLFGRWHERRAKMLERALTAQFPPLRIETQIV